MESSLTCPGCTKTFGRPPHLIQHWLKTENLKCKQAAEVHRQGLRLASEKGPRRNRTSSSLSHSPNSGEGLSNEEPARFDGDFYGDSYSADDFPGFDHEDQIDSDEELGYDGMGHNGDDDDEDEDVEDEYALEQVWEPDRNGAGPTPEPDNDTILGTDMDVDLESELSIPTPSLLAADGTTAAQPVNYPPVAVDAPSPPPPRHEIYIDKFGGRAGRPTSDQSTGGASGFPRYQEKIWGAIANPWAPFTSQMDWEVARWAKLRGLGSTAFSDLLRIDGVTDALGLSYSNSKELNQIIDSKIPSSRPAFVREEVVIAGQSFDLFKRDILECIRSLYGDPKHSQYLCIVPERHYSDADKTVRLYHDFHTGRWWWSTQQALEEDKPGATIIPIILSSDKTQITLFRNKSAYPVYLTIGNLPKEVRRKPSRRGQILLAYLPTTRLEHIKNKAARRRTINNLFHACMSNIVQPLKEAGLHGVVMTSGDGINRRCHPIFAAYVGDYPEQVLVTCTYTGDSPVCECPADRLGEYPCQYQYRDFRAALQAVRTIGTTTWADSCFQANIKPVQHPFWEDLPYVDIFSSITPDILHQLLQGVMKHLIGWLTEICGAAEIDARIRRLPPGHGIRIFYKGISMLSRISGTEHKQICSFILGVVTDITLPDRRLGPLLLSATHALLDFLSLARYPIHSNETLQSLEAALAQFHANKEVFVTLGVRENFNFPKLHFLAHYVRAIKLYGTTDNYNTEATERLHIDFAKDAYASTNRKDEFLQMTKWLERREKITYHADYVTWRCTPSSLSRVSSYPSRATTNLEFTSIIGRYTTLDDMRCSYEQKMTRFPTIRYCSLKKIQNQTSGYGATLFKTALARFIARYRHPDFTAHEIEEISHDIVLPFRTLPVYHRIKFLNTKLFGQETQDSVHAYPQRRNARKLLQESRFDTALIKVRHPRPTAAINRANPALEGMRIGRVRVIFALPQDTLHQLFPSNVTPPAHLAYVEWFSRFTTHPEPHTNMYKVKREIAPGGTPLVTILPIELIQRSVYLFPKWGASVPADWASHNVLDRSPAFFMSPFRDIHTYYEMAS